MKFDQFLNFKFSPFFIYIFLALNIKQRLKPKLFLLFISIVLISCNARYAYRSKVKINDNKSITKKEFSASIDSKIEASIEGHYQAIDNNKLRKIEFSDSLPSNIYRYSPVKEFLLKFNNKLHDTIPLNFKNEIPPSVKKRNTIQAIIFFVALLLYYGWLYSSFSFSALMVLYCISIAMLAFIAFQKIAAYKKVVNDARRKQLITALNLILLGSVAFVAVNIFFLSVGSITAWWILTTLILIGCLTLKWALSSNFVDTDNSTDFPQNKNTDKEKSSSSQNEDKKIREKHTNVLLNISALLLLLGATIVGGAIVGSNSQSSILYYIWGVFLLILSVIFMLIALILNGQK